MKILWKSCHPDMATGYGSQSALLLPRLKELGHDIAVSCTAGQEGHHSFWNGIPVFGHTRYTEMAEDTVGGDFEAFGADLAITFLCTWRLVNFGVWQQMRTVHLMNVDCTPMSMSDYVVIAETGGTPAATSRRGWEIMRAGGKTDAAPDDLREPLDPLYLPHGTDTAVFSPATAAKRAEIRGNIQGVTDSTFVVGMNFMNNDRFPDRKNIGRQLRGFAMFHAKHPDSVLMLHAVRQLPEGYRLPWMINRLGISGAVRWTPQYELAQGMITPPVLADWYRAQDVYLGAGNEGFGLPGLEAIACGTPAILLNAQSGPELAGDSSWLVGGEAEYNEVHQADWLRPSPAAVAAALEEAYEDARNRREAVREHALNWDIGKVVREHWEPALAELA